MDVKYFATALLLALLLSSNPAFPEIEKWADLCDSGMCLRWWPKLGNIKGWHQDGEASHENAINILVPDGFTFANAETVIYAKANFKPRMPETKSLDGMIRSDKREFLSQRLGILITDVAPLATGDGKLLKTVTFFPNGKGDWEEVAYGEEGEFYLIFTLSSRTRIGFEKSLEIFREVISQYKENPQPEGK